MISILNDNTELILSWKLNILQLHSNNSMLKLISFSSIIYCYCNTKEWFQLQLNIIGKLFEEIEFNWWMIKFNIKSQTDVRVSFPKLTNRSPNYRWTLDNEYLIYPEWCYLIQLDISKNQLQFNSITTKEQGVDLLTFNQLALEVCHLELLIVFN